ncbi:MAG: CotH kinase family protein, partial [Flavobacteriales bacterium]|nr:CotH kinase family protein [Flavobacteriales bacterium]
MRPWTLPLLLLVLCPAGRAAVLINEVQPSNHGALVLADGSTPDWVELVNTGPDAVDLLGMRVVLGDRVHVIDAPLPVPAGGRRVLHGSGRPAQGTDHLVFKLPRSGGTLMLVAANGTDVLDVFTWPALPPGVSMGRQPDAAAAWSFFTTPSPGAPNPAGPVLRGITGAPVADAPPGHHPAPFDLALAAAEGARIHYTLDGSAPDEDDPLWTGPLRIDGRTVLRARAWRAGELPGPELCATYLIGHGPAFAGIVMDPHHLHGDSGIYGPGAQANHTRSGRAWERPAMVVLPGSGQAVPLGVRIHGSGSRGLAKRSFKLYARGRHGSPAHGVPQPGGTAFHEAILRADAGPHAFLRNLLIEDLVRRHGLHLDVQPSAPMPLLLNGRYWGLYRLMPPKDAAWARALCGAEAVDVLAGPSLRAVAGSDRHFRKALAALYGGAPMDSIAALVDPASLVDLACLDLWTGRADHDLNVRLYRPREPGGRWRWMLYDMDVWAPADDHSLARMLGAAAPEAPWLAPIMAHPELSLRLLARITALHAAVLRPEVAGAAADSIHRQHADLLAADHRRRYQEHDMAPPDATRALVQRFIEVRPAHLLRHLAGHTGR